ncbi:hypothetical protein HELRODRAFT_159811 [Helobdella robusta]|uniref:Uncharacterized protein n=1 Tax=Helobdella robusta TaxID=6412 RepID=T1EPF2_HELRO|nr:hypothetical protein HELRODRAFT_159811 [Helobdella robusta]ESO13180.1 hypothetical protein HELRODRAFT_159811 [Helobdella robusta]
MIPALSSDSPFMENIFIGQFIWCLYSLYRCHDKDSIDEKLWSENYYMFPVWWVSLLWITRHVWFPNNERLCKTSKIYINPLFDGTVLGESIMLNRNRYDQPVTSSATNKKKTQEDKKKDNQSVIDLMSNAARRNVQLIGVTDPDYYEFEAHVFFDNAMNNHDDPDVEYTANDYVILLVEVLKEAAKGVHDGLMPVDDPVKYPTPYGGRLEWDLPGENKLIVHLKDSIKIRQKKRWSQRSVSNSGVADVPDYSDDSDDAPDYSDEDDDEYDGDYDPVVKKKRRNEMKNPSWIEDKRLGNGEIKSLEKNEIVFFKDLIKMYLKPLIKDKATEEKYAQELKELRNKVSLGFLFANTAFVLTAFVLQFNVKIVYIPWPCPTKVQPGKVDLSYNSSTSKVDPLGFIFLLIFGSCLIVQVLAMIIHRFNTFLHIMSTTKLNFFKKEDSMATPQAMVETAKQLGTLEEPDYLSEDIYNLDEEEYDDEIRKPNVPRSLAKAAKMAATKNTITGVFLKRLGELESNGRGYNDEDFINNLKTHRGLNQAVKDPKTRMALMTMRQKMTIARKTFANPPNESVFAGKIPYKNANFYHDQKRKSRRANDSQSKKPPLYRPHHGFSGRNSVSDRLNRGSTSYPNQVSNGSTNSAKGFQF